MSIQQGKKAPDFTLLDHLEKKHSLSDYKGKWVLLYFYPKDDTPGCTIESCNFRDNFEAFKDKNIEIIGVSVDGIKSHEKFVKKYELPFTLLSDEEKQVVEQYEVWGKKNLMGREYMGINRTSFLIDPKGNIFKIYSKVKPAEHAQEILSDMA